MEVGEVVKCSISDEDRISWLSASAHDSDGRHEVVSLFFDDVKWNRMGSTVTYDASC